MEKRYLIYSFVISFCLVSIPLFLYHLPRNCDTWFYLRDLAKINVLKDPLSVFGSNLIYDYNPFFYFITDLLGIETPKKAAVFTSILASLIPIGVFFLSFEITGDEFAAFIACFLTASNCIFLGLENVFKSEVLGLLILFFLIYFSLKNHKKTVVLLSILLILSHPFPAAIFGIFLFFYSIREKNRFYLFYDFIFISMLLFFILNTNLSTRVFNLFFQVTKDPLIFLIFLIFSFIFIVFSFDFFGKKIFLNKLIDFNSNISNLISNIPIISVFLLFGGFSYFTIFKVPSTDFFLTPKLILYYSPTIILFLIGVFSIKKNFIREFFLSISVFILVGSFTQGTIPIYRPLGVLIPVLAISVSQVFKKPKLDKKKILLLSVFLFLFLITSYPSPEYTFGYEVQYYPEEYNAVEWLSSKKETKIFTDVTIGRVVEAETQHSWEWIGELKNQNNGFVLITETMIKYGARPPDWRDSVMPIELEKFIQSNKFKLIMENDKAYVFSIKK